MSTTTAFLRKARRLLAEHADRELAFENKKYFKSPFRFLGIAKGTINDVGRELKIDMMAMDHEAMVHTLDELWQSGVHEEMTLGVVLAALVTRKLRSTDISGQFSRWLDRCETWDHVDELCIRVVGVTALQDAGLWRVIGDWSRAKHLWKRRASLVAHLPAIRAGRAHAVLLESTCHQLAPEKDFFIRKAIGWVLREFSEHDPETMLRVFQRVSPALSGLSRRESTRKLSSALIARIAVPAARRTTLP